MEKDIIEKQPAIDQAVPRRVYFDDEVGMAVCPECGVDLIENDSSVQVEIETFSEAFEIMSNLTGSHFCPHCPVVVLNREKIEEAATLGGYGDENIQYKVTGLVDFKAIPKEKKHLGIGTPENPVPLVPFLPPLKIKKKRIGRNDPCPCGSGKKYKKCCGSAF